MSLWGSKLSKISCGAGARLDADRLGVGYLGLGRGVIDHPLRLRGNVGAELVEIDEKPLALLRRLGPGHAAGDGAEDNKAEDVPIEPLHRWIPAVVTHAKVSLAPGRCYR